MGVKLHKPVLLTGIGLSMLIWLWESLGNSVLAIGEWSLTGAIALGGGLWLLQSKKQNKQVSKPVQVSVNSETVTQAITKAETMINTLACEAPEIDLSVLQKQLNQFPKLLEREQLTITLTGGQKVGKTTLKKLLESREDWQGLTWKETPAFLEEVETILTDTDLLLFLTNGDLTESEWQKIQQWRHLNHNIIIIFNKQDQYLPEEAVLITAQLKQRVKSQIPEVNVISITAAPMAVKVRQHQTDGSIQEWTEAREPVLEPLETRLREIIPNQKQALILATTWRQAVQLQQELKNLTNQVRFQKALPIIEQYQWLAATTAVANPVAAIDVLITMAINGQMIIDLGKIYQQQFSLSQAQTAAATLGELMLKLGLVEISTQTVAGMLKTNAFTYLAGGTVQGVSAAYLTRVAGLSLVEYFQELEVTEENWNLEKLGAKLKQVFAQNNRIGIIQNLIKPAT